MPDSVGASNAQAKINGGRRQKETAIVTKGHILYPPHNASYTIENGNITFTIQGKKDALTIICNKIIVSKFRPSQIDFITIDDEGNLVSKRTIAYINNAFLKILDSFPPGCPPFDSDTLYKKIRRLDGNPQAHARRRWKDLKYNYGFDLDFDLEGNRYWRGNSPEPIRDPDLRPDDKKLQSAYLDILANRSISMSGASLPRCNFCDTTVRFAGDTLFDGDADDVGLLDHRRPIFQGGDDTLENLQIFCQTCNNKKNSLCRKCPFDYKCNLCAYAFPEAVRDKRVIVFLESDDISRLKLRYSTSIEEAVKKLISEHLQNQWP